jgi:disulfide oxidoreductase YuzD
VREELQRRFADQVVVSYYDGEDPEVRSLHAAILDEIETRGLLYPVTVVDGVPLYDGAVSYPAIMRAVGNKIAEREATEA